MKGLLLYLPPDIPRRVPNDNTALRRMNLRSFLNGAASACDQVPITAKSHQQGHQRMSPRLLPLKEAKSRVESHLEHINMKTKQEGTATWSLRSFRRDSRKNREVINIEMRELSMKTVGWTRESTRFIMEGPLQLAQPADGQWLKKGSKSLKFQNVQSLLMVCTLRNAAQWLKGVWRPQRRCRTVYWCSSRTRAAGSLLCYGSQSVWRTAWCPPTPTVKKPSRCWTSDARPSFPCLRQTSHSAVVFVRSRDTLVIWDPGEKRRNALPNIMINTTQSRSWDWALCNTSLIPSQHNSDVNNNRKSIFCWANSICVGEPYLSRCFSTHGLLNRKVLLLFDWIVI